MIRTIKSTTFHYFEKSKLLFGFGFIIFLLAFLGLTFCSLRSKTILINSCKTKS